MKRPTSSASHRKKPGHREGVRSNRRPGQLALVTEGTLRPKAPTCAACKGDGCEFCPRVSTG